MNAPPVLRPLRAILQRRLQTAPTHPARTPSCVPITQLRSQRRYKSTDKTSSEGSATAAESESKKPAASDEKQATPAPKQQAKEDASTGTLKAKTAAHTTRTPPAAESQTESPSSVITNFDLPKTPSSRNVSAPVPRLDGNFVKAAFQKLKTADEEIQAGIAKAVASQLEAEAQAIPEAVETISESIDPLVAEALAAGSSDVVVEKLSPEEAAAEALVDELTAQAAKIETPQTKAPVSERLSKSAPAQTAATSGGASQAAPGPSGISGKDSKEDVEALMAHFQKIKAQKAAEAEAIATQQSAAEAVPESPRADAVAPKAEPIKIASTESETESSRSQSAAAEAPTSQDVTSSSSPASAPRTKTADEIYGFDSISGQQPEPDMTEDDGHDLQSVLDEELAAKVAKANEALAEESEAALEAGVEDQELSRLPRNVQAFYLQPLRRKAQYGVPSCDLQLRSYSVRPLESFCDFALRAAYYLGLPAYGPTPLPKIIQRWTVPRSVFVHKKSQENFERITRRRLIQIKDGHPETVQIWLAFLQKHQQAAVGMKANMWEFSSVDVAKEMDKALEEADPVINDKLRLLVQKKEFETVEKVDEFLQSERYRLVGGQYTGGM